MGADGLTVPIPYFSQVTLPLPGFFAVLHHVNHPGRRGNRDLG